jgi:hypothetical protein
LPEVVATIALLLAVAGEVELIVEAQDTAEGRFVTPFVLQRFCAYATAEAWSAASQAAARQQAIPLRKLEFEQIQATSRELPRCSGVSLAFFPHQSTGRAI